MNPLIFQSDFGAQDGAVSAMYGVAYTIDRNIRVFDLTHEIEPYNIWDASYRLIQTVAYWPEGSVFVSVVDPGVGTDRRSIVAKTALGHYIVTPDNGTLTHIKKSIGISEARVIDEKNNRLKGSEASYTFHGRDVYAYTGARLASGKISFSEVGPSISPESIAELPTFSPVFSENCITGTADILDVRFGSLWTNIKRTDFQSLGFRLGDRVEVLIRNDTRLVYQNTVLYSRSFADVKIGDTLVYVNSLDNMAIAINLGNFARAYNIGTGNSWKVTLKRV